MRAEEWRSSSGTGNGSSDNRKLVWKRQREDSHSISSPLCPCCFLPLLWLLFSPPPQLLWVHTIITPQHLQGSRLQQEERWEQDCNYHACVCACPGDYSCVCVCFFCCCCCLFEDQLMPAMFNTFSWWQKTKTCTWRYLYSVQSNDHVTIAGKLYWKQASKFSGWQTLFQHVHFRAKKWDICHTDQVCMMPNATWSLFEV